MLKYLILGAGPAGLTFANYLKLHGEDSFLVLEKESVAGGLCRSEQVDGSFLDTGGGHFLDVRRPKVNEFLFKFMPEEEWNFFIRNSKIQLNKNNLIDHPIEANIWQLDTETQIQYLLSIVRAGSNMEGKEPGEFIDWIYWKLGEKIADDYMIPYNKKMFGGALNELGTYWLDKLPNVSFEETLRSCLTHKAHGAQPGHAKFYYPKKYGYGELWLRMANVIKKNIVYNAPVTEIDFNNTSVTANKISYSAQYIITTIPWNSISLLNGVPADLQKKIKLLKHTSIQVEYFSRNLNLDAHWIYYPNPELSYHRILLRHNFCANSQGYWTETNLERVSENKGFYKFINNYAYPLNTIKKPEIMIDLLSWSKSKNVIGLGRWGEHQHYNSDATVEYAMKLAEKMLC